MIKDLFDGVITMMRTIGGEIELFPIIIDLHQESKLNPYLFALVMAKPTMHVQD